MGLSSSLPQADAPPARTLATLAMGEAAVIAAIDPAGTAPDAALRLLEMGFGEGVAVTLAHVAPMGGSALVVQVGPAQVALRRAMAALVVLEPPGTPEADR